MTGEGENNPSFDSITPEALEAAGWVNTGEGWFELPPSRDYDPEILLWMKPCSVTSRVSVFSEGCHDTIGYALTMSEINAITTVAKRTMRKE